jgi:hypothetical protein
VCASRLLGVDANFHARQMLRCVRLASFSAKAPGEFACLGAINGRAAKKESACQINGEVIGSLGCGTSHRERSQKEGVDGSKPTGGRLFMICMKWGCGPVCQRSFSRLANRILVCKRQAQLSVLACTPVSSCLAPHLSPLFLMAHSLPSCTAPRAHHLAGPCSPQILGLGPD